MTHDFPIIDGRYLLDAGPSTRGWHHMATALTCPQLYAYQYVLKVERKPSAPLIKGSLVHLGLAHYYAQTQAAQRGEDPAVFHKPLPAMALLASREGPTWQAHLEFTQAAVAAYIDWYPADRFRVELVEEQMIANIPKAGAWWPDGGDGEPLLYTQRPDLVIEDQSGRFWVVDHKTTGRLNKATTKAYARSGQMQGYQLFGTHRWGDRFGGVILNYLEMQTSATKGHSFHFSRQVVEVMPWRVRAHVETLRWGERLIEMLLQSGVDPWEWPKVGLEVAGCHHRYGECEYARLCDYGPLEGA